MSETTQHGENIADEIQTDDAYGNFDNLTDADVWNILDNIHTHILDTRGIQDPTLRILEDAMHDLEMIDEDLPL